MYTSTPATPNQFVTMTMPPSAPQLHQNLRQQIEFYFSDENLRKDNFLQALLNSRDHPGVVPVATIASFPRVREIYATAMAGQYIPAAHAGPADPVVVGMSLKGSNRVQVSDDGHWLRPIIIHNSSYTTSNHTNPPHFAVGGSWTQPKDTSPASVGGGTKATTASSTPSVSPTSFDSGDLSQTARERTVVWVQNVLNVEESEVLDAFTTETVQPMQALVDVGHCWYVVFASEEQAMVALEASRTKQIGGRPIHAMLQTPQHMQQSSSPCGTAPPPPAHFATTNPEVPVTVTTTLDVTAASSSNSSHQEHPPQMVLAAAYPQFAYPQMTYGISLGQHPVAAHQQGYVVGVPYVFHHHHHHPHHATGFVAATAPMEQYQWQQQSQFQQPAMAPPPPPPHASFQTEPDRENSEVAAISAAASSSTAGTMVYTTQPVTTVAAAVVEPAGTVYYPWNKGDNRKYRRKLRAPLNRNQQYRGGGVKGNHDGNYKPSSSNSSNVNATIDEQGSSVTSEHPRIKEQPQRKNPPEDAAAPPPTTQPEPPVVVVDQDHPVVAVEPPRAKRNSFKKSNKKKRKDEEAAASTSTAVATAAPAAAKDEDGNSTTRNSSTPNLSEEHFPALGGRSSAGRKDKQKVEQPPSRPYAAALMKKAPKVNKNRGSNNNTKAGKKQAPTQDDTTSSTESGDGDKKLAGEMAGLSVTD